MTIKVRTIYHSLVITRIATTVNNDNKDWGWHRNKLPTLE